MKFYVIGTNSKGGRVKTRRPLFKSGNLEEAVSIFEKYIQEIRCTTLYLVADFENSKKKLFGYSSIEDDYKDQVSILIIGQWELGNDKELCIRSDSTEVIGRGFLREFRDNLSACRYFLRTLDLGEQVEFRIKYKKTYQYGNHKNLEMVFDRKIASTDDIFKEKIYPTRKFHLFLPDWENVEFERKQKSLSKLTS